MAYETVTNETATSCHLTRRRPRRKPVEAAAQLLSREVIMTWQTLDAQLAQWSDRLMHDLNIAEDAAQKLATTISSEVRFLPKAAKDEMAAASPIPLANRLQELHAFQGWMDTVHRSAQSPYVVRAQVLTQNYICFLYLPESCFRTLSKIALAGSVTRKCAQFLTNNPIRAFRNAIAHANWAYREDFRAIVYWARKGETANEPMEKFEVTQDDLSLWQALSRGVAYAAFSNL
jgi:hypothetical protein